jgi:VWFA-related protein
MRRQIALAAVLVSIVFAPGLPARQKPAPAPSLQQPPVFRTGAAFVRVDVYPSKDGRIVRGLAKDDFQVFEDGKPQKIETFELVKVEPFTPDAEKRDPNTQEEGNELAADPKNRVFVLYLDTPHVSVEGAHATRAPLVQMLNRMMSPNDLFGVVTPDMRPRDLVFGRKVMTTEDMLGRNWPWGMRGTIRRTPEEDALNFCTIDPRTNKEILIQTEGAAVRPMIDELIDRLREDKVLTHLENLVDYLGGIRETRTSLIVFTEGWLLFQENQAIAASLSKMADTPNMALDPKGRLRMGSGAQYGSKASCVTEVQRLAGLQDQTRFRQLLEKAKRANVVFYPVNPAGLSTFDFQINQEVYTNNTGSVLAQDQQRLRDRSGSMIDAANHTGGLAVVNTNDLNAGLERIANQLSAYYVLGYYSSNSKLDGKYRQIDVKLKVPGLSVTARKGYRAPTEAEMAARNAPKPVVAPAVEAAASELADALGNLSRIRPNADLYGWGAQTATSEITVFAEVSAPLAEAGKWMDGGTLQVVLTTPAGDLVASGRGRLDRISRGASARIAVPAGAIGPWNAQLRLQNGGDLIETSVAIARTPPPSPKTLLSAALPYRAAPGMQSALHPVADFLFRRTERFHVEWMTSGPLDTREARLLDRAGNPLPVQVTLAERPGVLVADVNLAPLGPGDYILDVSVSGGGTSTHTKLAIRVQN